MDIKHVVNATAVITLGKDMVFRDYVQGAFRMRGIGAGQRITVRIIPDSTRYMNVPAYTYAPPGLHHPRSRGVDEP